MKNANESKNETIARRADLLFLLEEGRDHHL